MGIKINVKAIKVTFLISILFNDIIIPLIVFAVVKKGNEYNIEQAVNMMTQMFTPFLGAFCVFMHLTKYIDAKDNEIYFVNKKNKWNEVFRLYLVYIISNTVFFLWYGTLNKKFLVEWLHIVIMCFVFVTAAYCLSFAFRSISLAIIPCFIYVMFSITEVNSVLHKISYYDVSGMTMGQLSTKYVYFLFAAVVFAVVGNILNNRYCSYNE